jgi:integrase
VTLYRERELPQRKPRTREEYDRLLDRVILPRFGSKPIGEVTRREVADLRAAMATHPVNFNRARKMLAILYTFAEREGLTEGGSPTLFVKPYPETKRERRLSFEELKAIGAALAAVEVEQPERRTEIAYIRLSLLTGCRKTELLGARWDQVDLDRGLLVLPDAKTGAREVRLAPPAVAILRELLERTEREWIFPSRKKPGARLRDPRKTFAEVCKRAGLTPPAKLAKDEARRRRVRIHDLRRTTGSVGADLGLSLHAVGHLLGHSDPRTTTIYARLGGDAAHAAADRVAGAVAAALDGKPPAEVVPLDRGRAS